MNDIIHSVKCTVQTLSVSDISDKEPELIAVLFKFVAHDKLLIFISGINNNLLHIIMIQHILRKRISEGSRSACNQYCLSV